MIRERVKATGMKLLERAQDHLIHRTCSRILLSGPNAIGLPAATGISANGHRNTDGFVGFGQLKCVHFARFDIVVCSRASLSQFWPFG